MNRTPFTFKTILSRFTLILLHTLKRTIEITWSAVARITSFAGRLIALVFVLPVYRLFMFSKLRARRLSLPARGFTLFLLTNRYLFHVIVVALSVATIGMNLTGRQANAQDAGQQSLLYAMTAGIETKSTVEEVQPKLVMRDTHYIGSSSLIAVPGIDFDYNVSEQAPVTEISIPGTIAANLAPSQPNESQAPISPRTKTETYVVQVGDTLSEIAQRFGVNIGTILWANARTEVQYLRPGDQLKIPAVSGVLVTVKKGDTIKALAVKYGSDEQETFLINRLSPDEPLPIGLEIVLPGGQPPAVPIPTILARNGSVPSRIGNIPPSSYYPPSATPRPPSANTGSTPSTKLLWPTPSHVINQYYGWRHTGLDIDGDFSSPIYAAHDGVVTAAGWNTGGYGLMILIQGDGVVTRYGHNSKLFVKVGDKVKKGEVISMMGTTGRSTGTHLHFEVYINGRRMNPLPYIK
jgi:murein DD-endopeptidase MepM/ murein hydrolase activator NlpD